MGETLIFVGEDETSTSAIASPFAQRGWVVEVGGADPEATVERVARSEPVAAVFNMDGGCERARAAAWAVLSDARVLRPLMVFVGGTPEEIASMRADMPFGVFVSADELDWVIKHLAYKG